MLKPFSISPASRFTCSAIQFLYTVLTFKAHTPLILFSLPTVSEMHFLSFPSLHSHFPLSFFLLLGSLPLFQFTLLRATWAFSADRNKRASASRTLMAGFLKVMEDEKSFGQVSVRALKFKEIPDWLPDGDIPSACEIIPLHSDNTRCPVQGKRGMAKQLKTGMFNE